MSASVAIAGRPIGPDHPPYIIAEMSGNHNGDLNRALALIDAAADAGADAVKLQTYTADTMTIDHHGPGFDIEGGLWKGRSLYELYEEAHTPWDWHPALFARAKARGITAFSTPFDPTAVDYLTSLDAPAYKIASFEVIDLPLIEHVARQGKPVIVSSGMASDAEIGEALAAIRDNGNPPTVLLHCVSAYPAPAKDINLRRIPYLAQQFGAIPGLSDHTMGTTVAIGAIALGATVIEKHFTLARADGGPDAAFSLEPNELADLVTGTRTAWEAMGIAAAGLKPSEKQNLQFRRSLYVVADIKAGERFTPENLRAIRPGFGLPPKYQRQVMGLTAAVDLARGTPLTPEHVAGHVAGLADQKPVARRA
ncbi:MAG TPA: pseudaminic acid synthase [Magnetospirillaceae bacterium]